MKDPKASEFVLTKESRSIDYVHLIKMFLFTPKFKQAKLNDNNITPSAKE